MKKTQVFGFFLLSLSASFIGGEASGCTTFDYTIYGEIDKKFECSGHGTCTPNNTCVCDDGWTGLSDIINTEGVDCQISIPAVKGIWGVTLLLAVWGQYKGFGHFVYRWKNFRTSQAEKKKRGIHVSIFKQQVLLACFCFEFLCLPCTVLLGLVRIIFDDERVGITFTSTLLFALAKIGFYLGNFFYNPTILALTLRDGKKFLNGANVDQIIQVYRMATKALTATSILLGFLPFIVFFDGGELNSTAEAVYLVYFIGMVLTIVLIGLQSLVIAVRAGKMFEASYQATKDEKIRLMKEKVTDLNMSGVKQAFVQVLFYLMFLLNPYAWNLHDYFLPISWISFIILGKKMMTATVREGDSTTKRSAKGTTTLFGSKSRNDDLSYAMTNNVIAQSSVAESENSDI
mmetsp:Transcript_11284/g.12932  ORF Transcript_11284/g.12932 Transcript_11284/m.12932 type:complete len:402 (-) Transcript_11284:151-1356(-)